MRKGRWVRDGKGKGGGIWERQGKYMIWEGEVGEGWEGQGTGGGYGNGRENI